MVVFGQRVYLWSMKIMCVVNTVIWTLLYFTILCLVLQILQTLCFVNTVLWTLVFYNILFYNLHILKVPD